MAGAPEGNQNSSKSNRLWGETIKRAVLAQDPEKLRKIADKLIEMAAAGDLAAMKELGDRIDGKAAQSVALTNPEGGDLFAPLVSAAEALRGKIRETK
jgi:hypothetical protein